MSRIIKHDNVGTISDMSKKKEQMSAENQLRSVAKQILNEARKRAHFEMECLTQMLLQEAKAVARYSRQKPFYIS
ncbi:FAM114 family protein [Candidatus Bathyarchaeota archaeon]|nr:FAM114 family protein [Candidatus Bathyarchaeota archaeon]